MESADSEFMAEYMRKKMCNPKIVVAGFIMAFAFSMSVEAKLYKWVDNDGNTHYGEVIPPEYASKDNHVANKPSVRESLIEIVSPEMLHAKEERLRAKQEEAANKTAAKKEMEEKKRRDIALLNTYSSEKEIDEALERNLAMINARIESNNILLKSSQGTLDVLKKEFNNHSREGRSNPQSLYDDISLTESNIARYRLEKTKGELVLMTTRARFENDKILYRKVVVDPVNDAEKIDANDYSESSDSSDYPEDQNTYKRSKKAKKRY